MNKTVDPIKMYVERYRHTVENTPREVDRASRNLSLFGGIFGWDVSVHVECAAADGRYTVIHSQADLL